jgi:hypothetical protein
MSWALYNLTRKVVPRSREERTFTLVITHSLEEHVLSVRRHASLNLAIRQY